MNRTRTQKNNNAIASSRVMVSRQAAVERYIAFLHLIVLLGLTITFLMSSIAFARAAESPQVAALPLALPTAPLALAAVCDAGVAVFSVKNTAARWRERGGIRIIEVATGRVVRERRLTLGERQTASFRVASNEMQGEHTRIMVALPDDSMTYVKSFTGRCVAQR